MLTQNFPKFNFEETQAANLYRELDDPEKISMLFETRDDKFVSLEKIN
jgi:hypothetical protein